jgi:hypothetical protein
MYPKIETLFNRGKTTFKVLPEAGVRVAAFDAVDRWIIEEKCDGMNIRLVFAPDVATGAPTVRILGRTDNANFRPGWRAHLEAIVSPPGLIEKLLGLLEAPTATVYGELMGPKINGNPHGLAALEFQIFDVRAGSRWASRGTVLQVADALHVSTAPCLGHGLHRADIVDGVRGRFESTFSLNGYFEGVVARPARELFDEFGNRMIWKLKRKDFA